MKFRYVGDEPTEWFGFQWIKGVERDVTDAHAIGKLKNSVLFEVAEPQAVVSEPDKPKRGRPKKVEAEPESDEHGDTDAG